MQAREPGMDPQLKRQVEEAQQRHTETQRVERVVLEQHKAEVEAHSDKKNMVSVDQTKSFAMPHFHPTNSVIAVTLCSKVLICVQKVMHSYKLDVNVGGLMDFGSRTRWLYASLHNVRGGGNFVITILFFYLRALKTSATPCALAPALYLQVDGGSENCNRYACAFS
jgi:hypothetical protein